MNSSAAFLVVLLVLMLGFNGRKAIRRGLARVPLLVRGQRVSG